MRLLALNCVVALICCSAAYGEPITIAELPESTRVSFEHEILPIFRRSCLACHSASEQQGSLILETPQSLRDGGDSGPAIVPGRSGESLLLKLAAHQEESFMPPPENNVNAPTLTSKELGLLRLWIDQGARGSEMASVPVSSHVWQPLSTGLSPVYTMVLSSDGQHVAVTRANQLYVYHLRSGKLLATLSDSALEPKAAHHDLIQSLAWSSDGSLLASGGFREVKLWRKPHDHRLTAYPLESVATALAVSPDRKLLATAEAKHTIQLWNAETGEPMKSLVGHDGKVTALCFTSDGQRLVSAAQDQTIRFWQCKDGTMSGVLEPPTEVRAIELVSTAEATEKQPNPPQLLVSGGADGVLKTWTMPQVLPQKTELSAELQQFAASDDAQWLVTSDPEGTVVVRQSAPSQPPKLATVDQWKLESGPPDHMVLFPPLRSEGKDASESGGATKMLATETGGELSLWHLAGHHLAGQWRSGQQPATALTASPDGTLLASGTSNGEILLWNVNADARQLVPQAVAGPVTHVAWNALRTQFAVAGKQEERPAIFVFDSESGRTLRTLTGHTAPITCYAFSSAGNHLVSGSEDQTVRVWKLDAPAEGPIQLEGHATSVSTVAFSPDGQYILSSGSDHTLRLWNTAEQKPIQEFKGHAGQIVGLGFLADQPFSVSADRTVRFWNRGDGTEARSFSVDATPEAMVVIPDRQHLVLARDDKQISIHRLGDGSILHTLSGHSELITSLSLASDGQKLVSTSAAGGGSGRAIVWDLKADPPRYVESFVEPRLTTTTFGRNSDQILTGSTVGEIAIRPLRLSRRLDGMAQAISSLEFSSDNQFLIAAAKDGAVRGYAVSSGQPVFSTNHGAPVYDLAISPDHPVFATAGEDGIVRLWNSNGEPHGIQEIGGMEGPCTQVTFSTGANRLLVGTGGDAPQVHVFDLNSGLEQQRFTSHRHPVRGLICGEAGHSVVSASAKAIWQWSVHRVGQVAAHDDAITAIVTAPDDPMQVFSASLDGKIRRWDLKKGKQHGQYHHGAAVLDLDVHPEGQRLASVSDNQTAKLWDVSGKQIAEMKGDVSKQKLAALMEQERVAATQRLNIVKQRLAAAEEVLAKRIEAEATAAQDLAAADAETRQKKVAVEAINIEEAQDDSPGGDAPADDAQQMLQDAEAAQKLAEQKRAAAVAAVKTAEGAVASVKKAISAAEANLQAVQKRLDLANRRAIESEQPLRAVRFSPDGEVVATAGDFPSVQLWNAETGAAVGAFSEQPASLHPMTFLDPRRLITASEAPEAIVWNIAPDWRLERTIGSANQPDLISDRVTSLAFDTGLSKLLVGGGAASRNGEVSLFRIDDGSRIRHWPKAHHDTVYSVTFSPDGTQFVSAGADKHVRLWNVTSESPAKQFEGHTDYVLAAAWKSDAMSMVSASGDQTLKVWNVETGDQQRTISGFGKDVTAVRFVGDSNHVVSSCGDGLVRLHDSDSGKTIRSFGAGVWLHCVDATADGSLVVAGSEDGRLFVWDGSNGKQLRVITVGQ